MHTLMDQRALTREVPTAQGAGDLTNERLEQMSIHDSLNR